MQIHSYGNYIELDTEDAFISLRAKYSNGTISLEIQDNTSGLDMVTLIGPSDGDPQVNAFAADEE